MSAYVNVINATNNRNIEALTTNFNFTQNSTVSGLPILPVVGVKENYEKLGLLCSLLHSPRAPVPTRSPT